MPAPGCCSAVLLAVTNTGDRGYRPYAGNARGSRSSSHPATRRGLLSVSTTATWSRTTPGATCIFRTFAPIFFISTTTIAFITPRPLWFAFASQASCNLTSCLMRPTHSHQETQGSADSVSRWRRVRRRPAQAGRDPTPRAPWGCAGSTAPRTCLSAVAPSTTLSPSVAAKSPHGPWPTPWATRPGATC